MKTILEFLDGYVETVEDHYPVFNLTAADDEDQIGPMVSCADADSTITGDDVPLNLLKRVVFEL